MVGSQSHVPVHSRRPSPRQVRHLVDKSLVLPSEAFPFELWSRVGSSHRFSPSRKTRCWDKSKLSLAWFTMVFWISDISVIELTTAPFSLSWKRLKITHLYIYDEMWISRSKRTVIRMWTIICSVRQKVILQIITINI